MTKYRNVEGSDKPGHSGSESVPLVVDLDGTLLRTDLLLESALRLIKQRPWLVLLYASLARRGEPIWSGRFSNGFRLTFLGSYPRMRNC